MVSNKKKIQISMIRQGDGDGQRGHKLLEYVTCTLHFGDINEDIKIFWCQYLNINCWTKSGKIYKPNIQLRSSLIRNKLIRYGYWPYLLKYIYKILAYSFTMLNCLLFYFIHLFNSSVSYISTLLQSHYPTFEIVLYSIFPMFLTFYSLFILPSLSFPVLTPLL